jgi:hypothetical protein
VAETETKPTTPRDELVEQEYTPGRAWLPVQQRWVDLRKASFGELPISARIKYAREKRIDMGKLTQASVLAAQQGDGSSAQVELDEDGLRQVAAAAIEQHIEMTGLVPEIYDDVVELASRLSGISEAEIQAMEPEDGAELCSAVMDFGLNFEAVNRFLGRKPSPARSKPARKPRVRKTTRGTGSRKTS